MKVFSLRLRQVCQGEYSILNDINIEGGECNIFRDFGYEIGEGASKIKRTIWDTELCLGRLNQVVGVMSYNEFCLPL